VFTGTVGDREPDRENRISEVKLVAAFHFFPDCCRRG
jgi:hypothetical protein